MNYIERIRTMGSEANPFFLLMGIEVETIGEGDASIRMPVRADMMNGEEWLQGGIFTALADEAMVLAIYTLLDPDETIATITETTTFMSGARTGATLHAIGRVVKKGKRVAFAEGEVYLGSPGSSTLLSRTSAAFAVGRSRKGS
ncbi:MAG: PaaI family thioesterase [Methanolinea sp.]|nr:PaaI family thioesterase [Methanolinea sp.]